MVRLFSVAGLVVLLGTGCLIAGGEDVVQEAGKETLATLRRSIDELREMNRQRRADPEGELRSLQDELAGKRAELNALREARRRLSAELIVIEEHSAAWVREWRDTQRQIAVGERYPSIKTLDGRLFSDAEIVAVTGAGIEVRHANGTARVRCDQLPSEWAERFVWKASEQEGVLAAEREQAAELDRQVAARMEIDEKRQEKRLAAEEAAESRAALARASRQRVAAASNYSSPLAEPARQVSNRTYYYRTWNDWNRRYCSQLHYRRSASYPSYRSYPSYGAGSHSRPISEFFSSGSNPGSNCYSDPTFIRPHVPSTVKPYDPPKR